MGWTRFCQRQTVLTLIANAIKICPMKTLNLLLLSLLLALGASAQTNNILTTGLVNTGKTKSPCGFTYYAEANLLGSTNQGSYLFPDTNYITVICTNLGAEIQAGSDFGVVFCGTSPWTFKDTNYPSDGFRFQLNLTNRNLITGTKFLMTTVGFTNPPP